ncbi:uncharacterized protein BDR25DRAFT_304922 [Lindgomyces ingoldianus]|uniref:Uncharacterized protein n=1 Tax=Lindgomyces ingoldianus TaxID=673940 RepID=A0ACB6QQV4_9PLEO|nr:uncharacterized protein BDR25DRAFT_304922 [Lindgomyces ingoldianus]KAF2468485.1 hypothetical protein BDR25DRAFT_304922 [Lindgomyces ingoldianus]
MRRLNVEVRNEQLPISALVRSPLFAVRYNLPNGKIRRMQLKFASGHDFDTAINHVRKLGLRISSSSSPQPSSISAPPGPSTVVNPSAPPEIPSPSRIPVTGQYQTTISTPPSSSGHQVQRASTLPTQAHPYVLQNRDRDRPASAYSAPGNRESTFPLLPKLAPPDPLVPPEYFLRPATSSSDLITPSSSRMLRGEHFLHSLSSSPRPSPSSSSIVGEARERFSGLAPIQEDEALSPSRPGTTLLFSHHDTNKTDLSCRRELPLEQSSSSRLPSSDTAQSAHRPSTAMEPPELPLPARTIPRALNAASRSSSRAMDLPPLPQPTFIEDTNKLAKVQRTPLNASFDNDVRPLSPTSQNARQIPSTASSPLCSSSSDTARQKRVISQMSETTASHADNLAAYASQSQEERIAALNDFMMNQLDDDNFVTLVEDVSICWARIALGLE